MSPELATLEALIERPTCCGRLAKLFVCNRNTWIDGRVLATLGGAYAWRTRLSDLRKAPWWLSIENRQRKVTEHGKTFVISEYRIG